jgi:hypothetical protein
MKIYIKQLLSDGTNPSFMRFAAFISLPILLFCLVWSVITKYDIAITPISGIIIVIFGMKALQSKFENDLIKENNNCVE